MTTPPAQAQPAPDTRIAALADDLDASQRAHLYRVGAWGLANAVAGWSLYALASGAQPARRGFGLQTGLWGTINTGIAAIGLVASGSGGDETWATAVEAERGYHDILLLNTGLNVAYTGVGVAMVIAGTRDVRSAAAWRGHGTALIVQGLGLLVLDGVALWASRTRLGDLLDVAGGAGGSAAPLRLSIVF